MITNEQIEELSSIINYLNQIESLPNEYLTDQVEDIEFLIKVLTTVKVTKIKKLINVQSSKTKKIEHSSYTKDLVMQIFTSSESNDIVKSYTLSQLKEMFIAVYGQKPLSKDTKEDIVSAIKKRIQQKERVAGFKELDNKS